MYAAKIFLSKSKFLCCHFFSWMNLIGLGGKWSENCWESRNRFNIILEVYYYLKKIIPNSFGCLTAWLTLINLFSSIFVRFQIGYFASNKKTPCPRKELIVGDNIILRHYLISFPINFSKIVHYSENLGKKIP